MQKSCAALIVVVFCVTAFADQIVLKNGDRLSGNILRSDAKDLVMETEFMGTVYVPWDAVQNITSLQVLHLDLKNGRSLTGPVTSDEDRLNVSTKAGTIEVPKASVESIRNDAEQRAFDKSFYPGFRENWTGGANIGFALSRGNSQTKNFALGFNADRKTRNDKLALYLNSLYSTNDAPGAVPSTTANSIGGGIRYDRDLWQRLFGFLNADFMTDDLQSLDLRSVYGGGIGFHAIKRESTTLDLLAGVNYTREEYFAFTRSFPAGTFGEELTYKISQSTSLTQKAFYYPDFSDLGEYRATFDLGTVTKVNNWLGWQLSFGDVYVTNPPLGKKRNDIIFTTGLNLSFLGKKEKCPCK